MWHRRWVTSFAWTRRAHDVPAVVGNLPALFGEILEDRTLLSSIADSSDVENSWAVLLGSGSSLAFLLPVDAVSELLANDVSRELIPVVNEALQEGIAPPSFSVRVDAQSNWRDVVSLPMAAEGAAMDSSQVLVTVEFVTADPADGAKRFANISVEFMNEVGFVNSSPASVESRFHLASDSDFVQPEWSLPIGGLLTSVPFSIGLPNIAGAGPVSNPLPETIAAAGLADDLRSQQPLAITTQEFANQRAAELDDLANLDDVKFIRDLTTTSMGSFSQPVAMLSSAAEAASVPNTELSVQPTPALFEPMVVFTVESSSKSAGAYDLAAIANSPVEGLQAAAAPLLAVVETVLASLDTTARTLLALLTGSGGGTSPIAPVVQPIVDSSHVVIDPKRPRWALHDGLIEELAAYSLVVAPDQHFDLKNFGPALQEAGPVVRIEFDVPPQHGQMSATEIPGSFRYSADPGFSGVDSARFRVTRASGQMVAGAVTILVNDRSFPERPPVPVRQVEMPIGDQRLSDVGTWHRHSTSAAIDASFELSDGGMDLP